MKMKERFHAVCRFLNMISQGNHRVLLWLIGSAFAAATLPYLSLFFSARILNLLLAKSYRACLYTVVIFLLVQYGLGLFEKICRQYLDGQKELCLALTEQKITAKALELEFEKKQNRQIYWDDVAMFCHFEEYELGIYPMQEGDLIEIDDFSELCDLDPSYCGYEAQGQEKSEEK